MFDRQSSRSCVQSRRLDCCCKALRIILSCWFPFALSSCGGTIVVNGANTGALVASPNTVAFGSVPIGQPASTTVSLLNPGSAPVEIGELSLSGKFFSVAAPSDLPITIAPGGTYNLNVQFNPAAEGTAAGQLTIASSSSARAAAVIKMNGTGAAVTGSAALSALSCSNGAITGLGTDACTVTMTAAAPRNGLTVNLSSSSSAVQVPNAVNVPAGETSVGFSANVASVASAQAVTITASAGGVMKNFTLQLNAAILALSINATSVAFGDVVVNTPATQPLTLTSTGTLPITINTATFTGAGFTVSGPTFPATLNPGQAVTLNIVFDPTAAAVVTGQLTINTNSPTNGTAVIGLSGTGTPKVIVALTPTTVSVTAGVTQQFAPSVTGTSNTSVTWAVSGTGCNGVTCGTISSTGLYTAPAIVPSPSTVTITAISVSDSTKSASAAVTILPPAGTKYYLAPSAAGGNDSNSGVSPAVPWLTPLHSVNCGDVIIALASTAYSDRSFTTGKWGTVKCPAGNGVAWLKCVKFDACKIRTENAEGFYVDSSYWGIQGWEVTTLPGDTNGTCFNVQPNYLAPTQVHHIIFANDIANGCSNGGFSSSNGGRSLSASFDFIAYVGNIAYNSTFGGAGCTSGFNIYQPLPFGTIPGTHIYIAGNFAWDNFDPNPCAGGRPTDGNGIILDTLDGSQGGLKAYTQQIVVEDNFTLLNGGRGIEVGGGGNTAAPVYIVHNTIYGNNRDKNQNNFDCGEIYLDRTRLTQTSSNLIATGSVTGCGSYNAFAMAVTNADTTDLIDNNFLFGLNGHFIVSANNGAFTFDPNNILGTDPRFLNSVDPGPPSCASYSSVSACMAPVIANFSPSKIAANGYGYRMASNAAVHDPLFPQWLCIVGLPEGLVTMGCLTDP